MSEQLQLEDEEISITLRRAWDRTLRLLATRVNKPTFEGHIRSLRPLTLSEETEEASGIPVAVVTLGVPSAFSRDWVEKRHAVLIKDLLEEILDRVVLLRFALIPKEKTQPGMTTGALPLFAAPEAAPTPAPADTIPEALVAAETPGDTADDFALLPLPTPALAAKPGSAPADPRRPAETPVRPAEAPSMAAQAPRRSSSGSSNGSASTGGGSGTGADALNRRYTFDSFVTGPSNRLAQAGAKAVAESPGRVYNPLFVYGPPGLGKTHLMHAIGNEIVQQSGSGGRIAYISGEAFTTHHITSIRERKTEEFRRKWRSVDLWLVDDIQFIAGKESTKEEFFHTFNTLYQMGKQIVISSDRSPRDLRLMDERLRSRFECGLIADIAPPELETRLAILHRKAEAERMRIPDDVLLYMAKLVQSNIRTLEGALVKLVAYASLVNSPVTTELASSILERYYIAAGAGAPQSDGSIAGNASAALDAAQGGAGRGSSPFAGRGMSAAITADLVQRIVARRFGMNPDALSGKKRDREIVQARQIAMHLMRELTETSLPGIGQLFGGRDHSTVSHSCDRVRSQLPFDDDLRTLVEDLATQIRAETAG